MRLWRLAPGQASTSTATRRPRSSTSCSRGSGRVRVDDAEPLTLAPFDSLLVEPGSARQLFNDTDAEELWLVAGAPPEAANTLEMSEVMRQLYPDGPKALPPELMMIRRPRPAANHRGSCGPARRPAACRPAPAPSRRVRSRRRRRCARRGWSRRSRQPGLEVDDRGDREVWRWRPSREEPWAQNLPPWSGRSPRPRRGSPRRRCPGPSRWCSAATARSGSGPSPGTSPAANGSASSIVDTHADLNVPDSVRRGGARLDGDGPHARRSRARGPSYLRRWPLAAAGRRAGREARPISG